MTSIFFPRSIYEALQRNGLTNAVWTDDDWNGDRAVRSDEGDFILYANGTLEKIETWGEWPPDPDEPLLADE